MKAEILTRMQNVQTAYSNHIKQYDNAAVKINDPDFENKIKGAGIKKYPHTGEGGLPTPDDRKKRREYFNTITGEGGWKDKKNEEFARKKSEITQGFTNLGINELSDDYSAGFVTDEEALKLIETLPKRYTIERFSERTNESILSVSQGLLGLVLGGKVKIENIRSENLRDTLKQEIEKRKQPTDVQKLFFDPKKPDFVYRNETEKQAQVFSRTQILLLRALEYYQALSQKPNYEVLAKIVGLDVSKESPESIRNSINEEIQQINTIIPHSVQGYLNGEQFTVDLEWRQETIPSPLDPGVQLALVYIAKNTNPQEMKTPNRIVIPFEEIAAIAGVKRNATQQSEVWDYHDLLGYLNKNINKLCPSSVYAAALGTPLGNELFQRCVEISGLRGKGKSYTHSEIPDVIRLLIQKIGLPKKGTLFTAEKQITRRISRAVTIGGERVMLTPQWFSLVKYIFENPGCTATQLNDYLKSIGINTTPSVIIANMYTQRPQLEKVQLIISEGNGRKTTRTINPALQISFGALPKPEGPKEAQTTIAPLDIRSNDYYRAVFTGVLQRLMESDGNSLGVNPGQFRTLVHSEIPTDSDIVSCITDPASLEVLLELMLTEEVIAEEQADQIRAWCDSYSRNLASDEEEPEDELSALDESMPAKLSAEERFLALIDDTMLIVEQGLTAIHMEDAQEISVNQLAMLGGQSGAMIKSTEYDRIVGILGIRDKVPLKNGGHGHPVLTRRQAAGLIAYKKWESNPQTGGARKNIKNIVIDLF